MYRAHITVTDPDLGRILTVDELRSRRLAEALATDGGMTWHPGWVGTRYGRPGIWVTVSPDQRAPWGMSRGTKAPLRFRLQVDALVKALRRNGFEVSLTATNAQSLRALFGLKPLSRG